MGEVCMICFAGKQTLFRVLMQSTTGRGQGVLHKLQNTVNTTNTNDYNVGGVSCYRRATQPKLVFDPSNTK